MTDIERREQEKLARKKVDEDWDKHDEVIVEYGNFCIKLLITLNSTAILSCIAFLGTFSKNKSAVFEAS